MSGDAVAWAKKARTGHPTRKLILLTLADYADDAWSCFPGQQLLADVTELSVRQVRRLLDELEAAGFLRREARMRDKGRGRTSDRYYLGPDQPDIDDNPPDDQPDIDARPTGHPEATNRTRVSGEEPQGVTPRGTPSTEKAREQLTLVAAAPASSPSVVLGGERDLAFGEFWAAYPRKVAKGAARKAWATVRRRGVDAAVIVAGARRYAADPNRSDDYTAHPATWLNGERWDDEPLPARGGQSPAARTMATARRVVARMGDVPASVIAEQRRAAVDAMGPSRVARIAAALDAVAIDAGGQR